MKQLLFIILSFYTIAAGATDYTDLPAYEIEVVLFEQKNGHAASSEIWPDLVTNASTANSIELHFNSALTQLPGVDQQGYYYSSIRQSKLRLMDEVEKLKSSGRYEILYHQGWIQPGLSEELSEPVHLVTEAPGQNTSLLVNPVAPSVNAGANIPLIYPQGSTPLPEPKLDGTVKVVLGRYLHISFDLKYKRNLTPVKGVIDAVTGQQYQDIRYYPVQTHRRMRSKEVHYIDHPLIGILVLATPFELPVVQPAPVQGSDLMKLNAIPVQH